MAIINANTTIVELSASPSGPYVALNAMTSLQMNYTAETHAARHMRMTRQQYFVTYTDWSMQLEGLWDTADLGQAPFVQGDHIWVK